MSSQIWATRSRWSDNDRYWGPFAYAKAEGKHAYRPWAIAVSSGGDEYPGCTFRISGFSRTLIVAIPPIIKPWRQWVDTSQHSWSSPNGGYWDVHRREYSISFNGSSGQIGDPISLHLHYGAQTHDSRTDQSKCYFLPWTQWRHVRHSLYGLSGEHFDDVPDRVEYSVWKPVVEACPTVSFTFKDYDGEELEAKTRIEEREWRHGEGYFKWLSWFSKPMIQRSLNIDFSGETGDRKGSWKGGTVGSSITMRPGELHESAFRRYCDENDMTFIR